ncbi:MAG: hypothetical protein ACYDC5_03370 [Candidatus Dormibacteria bacterium]
MALVDCAQRVALPPFDSTTPPRSEAPTDGDDEKATSAKGQIHEASAGGPETNASLAQA